MKRVVVAVVLAVVGSISFALPAQAATQSVCVAPSYGSVATTTAGTIYAQNSGTACKTVDKSASMKVQGGSYRVKYGTGNYSECRHNVQTYFNAYDGTSKITFDIYYKLDCTIDL